MKKISLLLFVLLAASLVSACGVAAAEPVEALGLETEPSPELVAPMSTDTPVLDIVSLPSDTAVPASPTASRIEFSVQNTRLEIKIVGVEKPYQVNLGKDPILGTDVIFKPGPGNMFIGLGIKVTNLTGEDIPMKWNEIYMINKYQDKWYPVWGAYQKTNMAIDPLTLELLKYDQVSPDFDPDAHFYVGDNGYARVIFQLPRDNLYYFFGYADLPLIEINWRYY